MTRQSAEITRESSRRAFLFSVPNAGMRQTLVQNSSDPPPPRVRQSQWQSHRNCATWCTKTHQNVSCTVVLHNNCSPKFWNIFRLQRFLFESGNTSFFHCQNYVNADASFHCRIRSTEHHKISMTVLNRNAFKTIWFDFHQHYHLTFLVSPRPLLCVCVVCLSPISFTPSMDPKRCSSIIS